MRIFTGLTGIIIAACVVFLFAPKLSASLDRTAQEVNSFHAGLAVRDTFGLDGGTGSVVKGVALTSRWLQ